MSNAHPSLVNKESAHQDRKVAKLNLRHYKHADLNTFAQFSPLNAFFAQPFQDCTSSLKILELGCGTGGTAVRLAGIGHQIHSIDISSKSIEFARQSATLSGVQDQITFRQYDVTKINKEYKPGEFDAICGIGILHHLDAIDSVLSQIVELRPKIVAFIEALGTNPIYSLIRTLMVGKSHSADEHPLKYNDLSLLHRLLPNVEIKYAGVLYPFFFIKSRTLQKIDFIISNQVPFLRLAKTIAIVWNKGTD